jgi:hypothetical protein
LLAVSEGLVSGDDRDDEALLRAHAEGDPDAFAVLFRRHRDRLWAVALRTMGDREDAADALQDALLSAHRAAAVGGPRPARPDGLRGLGPSRRPSGPTRILGTDPSL